MIRLDLLKHHFCLRRHELESSLDNQFLEVEAFIDSIDEYNDEILGFTQEYIDYTNSVADRLKSASSLELTDEELDGLIKAMCSIKD